MVEEEEEELFLGTDRPNSRRQAPKTEVGRFREGEWPICFH